MNIDNERFHMIRKVYQLTTTELAKLLGYSQTYISAIDRGVEPVSENVQKKLTTVLEIDAIKMREIELSFEKFKVK